MSSDPADASLVPKPVSSSVPFFCDFNKKSECFWKKKNYALGRQFDFSFSPNQQCRLKANIKDGSHVVSEVSANFETKWGHLELVETTGKGVTAKVHVHNIFHQWNLTSEHTSKNVEVTADYRPEGSFWCSKLIGNYTPQKDGGHVCQGKGSLVVQDTQYRLAVGAEVELEHQRDGTKLVHYDKLLKNYSMGFLYSPTETTQCSVIYKPNKDGNGVDYDLSLFKQATDKVSVAARAEGKADLRNSPAPVLSLGSSWLNNGNLVRGFMNTNKEYGVSYQVKVNPQTEITLGLASFLSDDGEDPQASVGFKLCFC